MKVREWFRLGVCSLPAIFKNRPSHILDPIKWDFKKGSKFKGECVHVVEKAAFDKAIEIIKCYRGIEGQNRVPTCYGEQTRISFGYFADDFLEEMEQHHGTSKTEVSTQVGSPGIPQNNSTPTT